MMDVYAACEAHALGRGPAPRPIADYSSDARRLLTV